MVKVTKFLKENEAKKASENSFSQNYTHESDISNLLASNPQSEGIIINENVNCSPGRTSPRSAKKTTKRGGIACCVPLCKNSYRNNPELLWYVILKDPSLRKQWPNKI